MQKKFFWSVFILCFLSGFSFFFSARGVNSDIVINEIAAYEPSGYEWVEIYNHGDEDVDLTDWKFWEAGVGHTLTPKQGDFILSSHEFALIVQDDKKFLEKYPFVTSTIFDSSWGTLNENGEEIAIKDNLGNFVEQFVYGIAENFSLERKNSQLQDYGVNNWSEHVSSNTVGQENLVASKEVIQESIPELVPENVVVEENILPQVIFQMSSSTVSVNTRVDFDASDSFDSDGTVDIFEWIFGDGTVGEGKQTSHIYTTTGTFFVELVVADNKLGIGNASGTLIVQGENDEILLPSKESLVISEFVSDPESGEEWIELYNFGTTTIDLSNILISDGTGVIANPTSTLDPKNFFVVKLSSSKLNNAGDMIVLTNNREELIDQVTYGNWDDGNILDNGVVPKKGNSLARSTDNVDSDTDNQDFFETTLVTEGLVNTISVPLIVVPEIVKSSSNVAAPSLKKSLVVNDAPKVEVKKYNASDILINEFVSDPADDAEEFIEFFNNTGSEIDLSAWYIEDGGGTKSFLQGKIFSKNYFVFEKPKGSLNNLGDTIILFDPNSQKIDQVTYGNWDDGNISDNAPAAIDFSSLSRIPNAADTNDDYKDFRVTQAVTARKSNILKEPQLVDFSTQKIVFSEVFPSPILTEGNTEFIELYNAGNEFVDLVGWKIKDNAHTYTIVQSSVASQGYVGFLGSVTHISLNNTGEEKLELFSPDGVLRDTLEYANAPKGQSFSKKEDGNFVWTRRATLAKENMFENFVTNTVNEGKISAEKNEAVKKIVKDTKKQTTTAKKKTKNTNQIFGTTLAQLREYDLGTRVKISGIVTAIPRVFASQYFYIGDKAAVQVYMNKKDFPDLALGDRVEVVGEIAETYGETRLKVSSKTDITVIDHPGELSVQEIEVALLGESVEGQLVQIHGDVTEIKSSYMYVDDGSAEIKVYFKAGANIEKLKIKMGDEVTVTGIVTQTNAVYQLLPRANSDIVILKTTPVFTEKVQESKASKYISFLAGFLVIAALFWRLFGNRILKLLQK